MRRQVLLDRMTRLFARAGADIARLAPADVLDAGDVAGTIDEVCRSAYARGGVVALVASGLLECADVTRSAIGARMGARRRAVNRGRAGGTDPKGPYRSTTMLDDLRHALRRMRSRPATALGAIAMLALAVGVTAAMFTVMDALVLTPVPFRDASRLVRVQTSHDKRVMTAETPATMRAWRSSGVFDGVYGTAQDPAVIEGGVEPVTRGGARIPPGMLEMLGAQPLFGRLFLEGEGRTGTDDRVILSEDLWRAQFGGDRAILGRRVVLSGVPTEVVGVMPASFHFPSYTVSLWRPLDFDAPPPAFNSPRLSGRVYARIRTGVPADAAATAAADARHRDDPATAAEGVRFESITANFLDLYSRRALTALASGVGLVFLALCANVTSLILARMTARRREMAVCTALGAARGRLLRQALLENLTIGVAGSAGGLGVGALLVALARHYLPDGILSGTLHPLAIDVRAVVATSVAGLTATLLAGVAPAWLGTRVDRATTMHLGERGTTAARGERAFSRSLLVAELALAVALLVGAGVLLRSFVNLARADRGLDAEGVITGWISLPSFAFADRPTRYVFADSLDTALRPLPGVADLALSYGMPPGAAEIHFGLVKSDLPDVPGRHVEYNSSSVENDFFRVYRIKLIEGRLFEPSDSSSDAIIGAQLAKMLWPGTSAVGHTYTLNGEDTTRVIGVVSEIRSPSFDPREDMPEVYRRLRVVTDGQVQARPFGSGNVFFGLRCAAACPDLDLVRQRIHGVNPHAVISKMGPLDDEFMAGLARPRAAAALALAFAIVATLVAAGGIFSVLSYAVGRRLREFGIRAAMGARPPQLGRLVVRDALSLGLIGLSVGTVAAWALGRSLAALAYGVTGADPVTWAVVLGVLAATTFAASWRPARQAMRADPIALLRDE